MARRRKTNRRTQKKQQNGNFLPFITGLSVGLFVAFVLYLNSSKPNTNKSENIESTKIKPQQDPQSVGEELKFDFYKILREREVKVPEWEPPKQKTPSGEVVTDTDSYIFQVGAFQEHHDADSVKARLTMLGFPVVIQRVVINGQKVWFRVRVGPYKDSTKLNGVRQRLSANNIDSILLRIKDDK